MFENGQQQRGEEKSRGNVSRRVELSGVWWRQSIFLFYFQVGVGTWKGIFFRFFCRVSMISPTALFQPQEVYFLLLFIFSWFRIFIFSEEKIFYPFSSFFFRLHLLVCLVFSVLFCLPLSLTLLFFDYTYLYFLNIYIKTEKSRVVPSFRDRQRRRPQCQVGRPFPCQL